MNESKDSTESKPDENQAGVSADREKTQASYRGMIKATTLVGGSTAVSALLRVARAKVLAVLLGPTGVGLLGVYNAIVDTATVISGMGVRSSGVRQIADATGSNDPTKVARTIVTLRRVTLALAAAGAMIVVIFAAPISRLTFGHTDDTIAIQLLGVAILFSGINSGQSALIQGLRQIKNLVTSNIVGTFAGTCLSVLAVCVMRGEGIVLSIILGAVAGAAGTWWYARRIEHKRITLSLKDTWFEARGLLSLGLVFMSSAVLVAGGAYLTRVLIMRDLGLEAAGFFQSAWALSGLYVSFILQAMGADYFPRLSALAHQPTDSNLLINQQTEVGLLCALPGVLAMLTFAKPVVEIFYSAQFAPATELLRWLILGMFIRVMYWPMGFFFPAWGRKKVFFWVEMATNSTQLALIWVGMKLQGLTGVGVGFMLGYVFAFGLTYLLVRRISGFSLSTSNIRHLAIGLPAILLVFLAAYQGPTFTLAAGLAITVGVSLYCVRSFCIIVGKEKVQQYLDRLRYFLPKKNTPN